MSSLIRHHSNQALPKIYSIFKFSALSKQETPIFLSIECLDLVSKLLDNNPNLRPSIDDVLNHPWMKSESDKAVNESKENEKLAMIKILVEKVDKLNEEKKQVNEAVAKAKNQNMNLKAKLGIAPKVKSQKNHNFLYIIMWPEPLTASQYSKRNFLFIPSGGI